jgi:hypothetical protein
VVDEVNWEAKFYAARSAIGGVRATGQPIPVAPQFLGGMDAVRESVCLSLSVALNVHINSSSRGETVQFQPSI